MQSSFLSKPPKSSSKPEGEQTKIDKGKKAMSSKDAKEESTKSDYDDKTIHVPGSTVESSKKKELKRRTSIYKQIQERMDYLRTTKVELGIDLDRPLSNQDPLDRLNDLANKKRKHADDIHDFFRANKRLKSSVQYKDHPAGTVLNELVLAEVFQFETLKFLQRQLFMSLEDWEVSSLQCMNRGGQVNSDPVLEVETFTNWKKRKPEGQWTTDERKVANLDQQLKSLIMFVLPDGEMNSVINCLTAKSTWDDLILYHEGPSDVKESRAMDLKNTNHVKDSELASLFGKLKYEENLINSIYEIEKNKSLVSATPLSTTFFSTYIVHDFKDSPDDEVDRRSCHEYLNDLEEEYQARALLAKSKRFFKKGTQRFSSAKATNQTECHKCRKKGHFARDCWSKTSVPSYQSPFQLKSLSSPQHKPELRPTKDFEAKYNKVKAKLALLNEEEVSLDDNEMVEVKVLMALAEENDVCISEQIPSKKKRILGVDQLTKDPSSSEQKDIVFVKSLADDTKVSIPGVERPWLSEAEGFILPNHDTGRIIPAESQRNTIDPSVAVTNSSMTDYDSTDESLVCSTPLPLLKKLDSVEPISEPKTIKSILRLKSTFKAKTLKAPAGKLKSVKIEVDPPLAIVNEPNNLKLQFSKSQSSYSKSNQPLQCEKTDHRTCDHAEYISTMNMSQHLISLGRSSSRSKIPRPSKRFFPPCAHCGCINHLSNECLYYPICGLCRSYDHDTNGHNRIISLERDINPRNPQHVFKRCEACGSSTHTTTDHYDIEWFKRGEALQAKKAEALKSTRAESSNANRSKTPAKSGCSRHMTGFKSYLHKYVEQPGPKVVFGDDSTSTTEGYGSIKCNGIVFTKIAFVDGLKSINHEKYTLAIVDEYSRYMLVYFLKKKSKAPETIMSFIKRVENQNDIKVKQLRTDNGTEFRNIIIVNFCDKKGISQNFSSPYTPEQNGVAKRKNRTLIEAARTMLLGSVFSKQYRTEAVATACYTQIYIYNHKDHLGKFDEKADDGYLLGYSLVSKAFRVFIDNINIAENERYPPDEYLHPYEPSQSAFLNGKLKEEVYVKQPPGFESNEFPNHVCKLDKALYELKQAPRAWYETLSTFLTEHKFVRGKIDNTLSHKTQTDVILVQIYVDDIIFGSTSTKLCKQIAKLMTQRYEMSMMGVLT
ncbi:retrovirus-related pol polyprotein from transposon TNT 1-94 [Tanacetum coccineum]